MTDSLFDGNNQTQTQIDETKNYLEELVGENKRHKTPEELAKAWAYADAHIAKIETENKFLREDNQARVKLEEMVKQLAQPDTSTVHTTNMDQTVEGLTPAQLEALVENKWRQVSAAEQAAQNVRTLKTKMQETWGINYEQVLEQRRNELGVTREYLEQQAKTAPKAFEALVGLKQAPEASRKPAGEFNYSPPSRTAVNTENQRTGSVGRSKAYWDNIRKTKPDLYNAAQEQRDAIAMGEAFFDT